MKKSDLKDGMIIMTRNGKIGLVIGEIIYGMNWWNPLSHYDEDMHAPRYRFEGESKYYGSDTDIVNVYELKINGLGTYLSDLLTKELITNSDCFKCLM